MSKIAEKSIYLPVYISRKTPQNTENSLPQMNTGVVSEVDSLKISWKLGVTNFLRKSLNQQ